MSKYKIGDYVYIDENKVDTMAFSNVKTVVTKIHLQYMPPIQNRWRNSDVSLKFSKDRCLYELDVDKGYYLWDECLLKPYK